MVGLLVSCWTDVNWASQAVEDLAQGRTANVTPHGDSMTGRVASGQTVALLPFSYAYPQIEVNDVVLVKVKGRVYLHLVKAIRERNGRTEYQIGNNRGGINGWVGLRAIYGIAPMV